MAARGIRGQSVASTRSGVALFGGFDDHFVRIDLSTGRVSSIQAAGRTVLYPWDDSHFVAIEEALGRPSKTRLTLRPYSAPSEVHSADGEWSVARRLIPGHFPTMFAVEGGRLEVIERSGLAESGATVGFVPGVFTQDVPVTVDGAWTSPDGFVVAGSGVGWGDLAFFAAAGELVVTRSGVIERSVSMGDGWRAALIEHDPMAGRVLVASWNRWGSLGGPSSDIYVFAEDGKAVARGWIGSLVERMAIGADGVVTIDVEDAAAFVELEAAAG